MYFKYNCKNLKNVTHIYINFIIFFVNSFYIIFKFQYNKICMMIQLTQP